MPAAGVGAATVPAEWAGGAAGVGAVADTSLAGRLGEPQGLEWLQSCLSGLGKPWLLLLSFSPFTASC